MIIVNKIYGSDEIFRLSRAQGNTNHLIKYRGCRKLVDMASCVMTFHVAFDGISSNV